MDTATPRYARIAEAFIAAIQAGRLPAGSRLPTIRQLAQELGVSVTTVLGAYTRLRDEGWISSEVGRGTFVLPPPDHTAPRRVPAQAPSATGLRLHRTATPWRRRALVTSAARLRAAFPNAADCTSGRPDPALLPLEVLQRAWTAAIAATTHADLQYSGPDPIAALADEVVALLAADGIPVSAADLIVGSSAQQFMVLALHTLATASDASRLLVAVEEPGYPTIFDTYDRADYGLVGVEVDTDGAVPASLAAALNAGARAVLLTPSAHNPTGASWSRQRMGELADVLADHPGVLAIEDDQFAGVAAVRPGSLLNDPRIADRVIYIRSFSKSIAPDMRIAVAVARPHLRRQLAEAKSFADGWSSRLAQRALAIALADRDLGHALTAARQQYAARRTAAADALNAGLSGLGGGAWRGDDGVNVWVHLPLGVDAARVVERAAALGILVAPGEPFFIQPGRHDALRINAGSVSTAVATEAGRVVAEAIQAAGVTSIDAFAV
jgi:GntR family transcriptional regulator/MocR family aminotransferase